MGSIIPKLSQQSMADVSQPIRLCPAWVVKDFWDNVETHNVMATDSAHTTTDRLDEDRPALARKFLEHYVPSKINAHTVNRIPLPQVVRLTMKGSFRLRGVWYEFTAEEFIEFDRGFHWHAQINMEPWLWITGFDRMVHGNAEMNWYLYNLFSTVHVANEKDIDHSAAGRMAGEFLMFPAVLNRGNVQWHEGSHEEGKIRCTVTTQGFPHDLTLTVDSDSGRLRSASYLRWGDPEEQGVWDYRSFGVYIDDEKEFDNLPGYVVPTKLRAGWYFDDTDRFESDGFFFDVNILSVEAK
eukprot:Clim_evm3s211 gene=Clim_evmTU3s211